EQFLDFLNRDVGLEPVIGDEQFHILAAHLAAEVLDRKLEGILRLLAEHTRRPRQRVDESDADFVWGGAMAGGNKGHKCHKCHSGRCRSGARRKYSVHVFTPPHGALCSARDRRPPWRYAAKRRILSGISAL